MPTQLRATVHELVQKGKGILAAVESSPTIAKRFSYGRALQDPAMQAWWGQPAMRSWPRRRSCNAPG